MVAHARSPRKRIAVLASIPVALVMSGAMVWQASYSAFTAKVSTPTNNWAAGTVALSDDDTGAAMFSVANMKPGATGVKCIVVTSSGTLASAVKLYATSYTTTNALSTYINLTIEEGTGGSFAGGCTGFVASSTIFPTGTMLSFSAKTSYATGVGGAWVPTGTAPETKSYRITYTLLSTAPDTAQGGTAAMAFTWEAQNT
jgi:glucose uptake protein GlcU